LKLVADNRGAFWTGVLGFPVEAGVSYQIAVTGIVDYDSETGKRRIKRGVIKLDLDFTTLMFSNPVNGSVFVGPTNVTLSLNTPLQAVDGDIRWAEFYAPRHWWDPSVILPIGSMASPPFSLTVSNLTPSMHVYGAVVTNHLGQPRVVAPVVFTVRPPNDDFSESIQLGPVPGITKGWISGASWEPGEKRPLKVSPGVGSIWWMWTAPETGPFRMRVNTVNSIALYKGPTLGTLRKVTQFGFGETVFEAVEGQVYHLQVYSSAQSPWDAATEVEFNLRP
jgi:hypothetical protein